MVVPEATTENTVGVTAIAEVGIDHRQGARKSPAAHFARASRSLAGAVARSPR